MKVNILKPLIDFTYQKAPKYKNIIKWCFAFIIALSIVILYELECFERLELLTVDYRFLLRRPKARVSDIVFIDMEEQSIKAIGRWPWSRKWHATLVKILSEYNPKAIVFDVIFSEPQDEIEDAVLEEAVRKSRVVYLPLFFNLKEQDLRYLAKDEDIVSVLKPLKRYQRWIKGTGHLNTIPDRDGILRRTCPVVDYGGRRTYQFGFKIGCDMISLDEKDIIFSPEKHAILLKTAAGKTINVPLDEQNQLIINWLGRWGKVFRHFSYIDVINSYALMKDGEESVIDFNIFKNKICIIGLTASGLIDIKPIPLEKAYPAVGVNAMVINSIVNNDFVNKTSRLIDILIILLITLFMTLVLFNLQPLNGMLLSIVSAVIFAVSSVVIFNLSNTLITTFYPVFAIVVSYGLTAGYTQFLQSIERMQLFRQATRDGLTHLYNVRHFNLLLEAEFKSVALYKARPLSLIMADIDNFKPINDTYGHQAGDVVLRDIADIIQSECRQIDIVARYGGEEFVIMLIGAAQKDAVDVAEKIRAAVENKKFIFRDKTIYTTISIGVAEFSNEKNKEGLVEKADATLYVAKRKGKNRVEVYS